MALPLKPPIKPQLALSRKELPEGDDWVYEPKYDGFRALAFVDGSDLYLQSRGGRPLLRYFPELEFPEGRYVLDGELVILDSEGREEFDALQNRLHPAESRVRMLAEKTPARFRAFDLLAQDRSKLTGKPFEERRAALEELIAASAGPEEERLWIGGADAADQIGEDRRAVAGGRRGRNRQAARRRLQAGRAQGHGQGEAGADDRLRDRRLAARQGGGDGRLADPRPLRQEGGADPIGHTSGLKAKEKRELVKTLKPYETGERGSGDPSRWDADRELEWFSLRPELVVEITYDHTSGGRIRHGSKIVRWREDKEPEVLLARPAGLGRSVAPNGSAVAQLFGKEPDY